MCGKQFGKKAILTDHIRTHTKEKPFKCPYEGCTKSFAEKGNMKIHYKRQLIKKEENKSLLLLNTLNNSNPGSTLAGSNETDSTIGGGNCLNLDIDYYLKDSNINNVQMEEELKEESMNSLFNMINLDFQDDKFFEGVPS